MPRFHGAIVAEKDAHGTRYIGVPEGRFMRNDPCWAKHGSHDTAKWLLAFRKTGVVDNMVMIAWESKPNEWALVHESRTLDFSLVQKTSRPAAGPDRFEPGASGMVKKATPVLPKGARLYYDFCQSDDLKSNGGYYTVRQLILLGNQCWRERKEEERNIETRVHKLKMAFELFERRERLQANGAAICRETIIQRLERTMTLTKDFRQWIEHSPPPREPGHENNDEKKNHKEWM